MQYVRSMHTSWWRPPSVFFAISLPVVWKSKPVFLISNRAIYVHLHELFGCCVDWPWFFQMFHVFQVGFVTQWYKTCFYDMESMLNRASSDNQYTRSWYYTDWPGFFTWADLLNPVQGTSLRHKWGSTGKPTGKPIGKPIGKPGTATCTVPLMLWKNFYEECLLFITNGLVFFWIACLLFNKNGSSVFSRNSRLRAKQLYGFGRELEPPLRFWIPFRCHGRARRCFFCGTNVNFQLLV